MAIISAGVLAFYAKYSCSVRLLMNFLLPNLNPKKCPHYTASVFYS